MLAWILTLALVIPVGIAQAADLDKARELFLSGEYETSLKELSGYLGKAATDDERGRAHFLAGNNYMQLQLYDDARQAFEKSLAAKSSLGAYAFYELGHAYLKLERYKDARLALERVGYFRPPNELR